MEPGLSGVRDGESRALTGLRGVGALLVMCHHFYLHLQLDVHLPPMEGLLRRGYMGVDLFFVLSGFVLAMVYGPWFDGSNPGGLRLAPVFLVRRVARLWPLHAAMLLVVVLIEWRAGAPTPSLHVLLSNFAMAQAWGWSTEINTPAWSVSTEFLAYLLFPLLAFVLLRSRMGVAVGLGCVVAALAICLALAPPIGAMRRGWLDIYYNYSLLPVLRCLAGFILGMVTWRVGQSPLVRRAFSNDWAGLVTLTAVLCFLLGQVHDLLIYALLPLLVLAFHHGRGLVWRALALGPLHRFGVLSYAVYLIHYTLLSRFPFDWTPIWEVLAIYLLVALGLAVVAHHLIEVPGRAAFRRCGEWLLAVGMKLGPVAPAAKSPLRDGRG